MHILSIPQMEVLAVAGLLAGVVDLWWYDREPRFIATPTFSTGEDGKKYYQYNRYGYHSNENVDGYGNDFSCNATSC